MRKELLVAVAVVLAGCTVPSFGGSDHPETPVGDDAIGYEKINYLMLMMVDPHVHYHVIPRYESPASFDGVAFVDHGWPGPPVLGQPTETDEATNAAIVAQLKQYWP